MKENNRFLIKTSSGFKPFLGIRRNLNTGLIITHSAGEIRCTLEHQIFVGKYSRGKIFRRAKNFKVGDKIAKGTILRITEDSEEQYYYDPVEVKDTNSYISDDVVHHNCLFLDEVSWVKSSSWDDFADAVFPAQGALAWKKTILTSTMKGLNHWYHITEDAKKGKNGFKFHQAFWYDVPRYDKTGKIIEPEEFKRQVISKHGEVYWQQNYENSAIGSSHTLLSAEKLKELESKEPINILTPGLKIYEKPQPGHKYIMSVDPSKDGIDAFAVNITDVTDMKFKQVAAGQLQIDYLLMPEYLVEWGEWYNFAFIVVENNEGSGQSVADMLFKVYEYENMYFDVKTETQASNLSKIRKKYPGFRTTTKSRKLILQTMKMFIENDSLELSDKGTIDEFFTFILINGKYQADEGTHDDAIMSLALTFAPFCSVKNFNDIKLMIDSLYRKQEQEIKVDISEIFTIGGFDDGTEENGSYQGNNISEFGGVVSYYDTLDTSNFG